MAVLRRVKSPAYTKIYKVSHPELPKNSHVVCMSPAQNIVYNPLICGKELRKYSLECSKQFLRVAWSTFPKLKKLSARQLSEVVVLRGSLGYQFDLAFDQLFRRYLPRCFVGARRFRISGGEFGADIFYTNFDSLPNNGVLFTGDTIATGSSISQTLSVIRSELRERDYDVRRLLVFSIAASLKGCTRLLEWEKRFREWWPNFRIHLFAAEALFGLADNGTDLLFRREGEVILPEETKARVNKIYGDYETGFLPGNICSIFDWGDRNFKPERHLEDVLKFTRESTRVAEDAKAKKVLAALTRNAKLKLQKLNQRLPKLK